MYYLFSSVRARVKACSAFCGFSEGLEGSFFDIERGLALVRRERRRLTGRRGLPRFWRPRHYRRCAESAAMFSRTNCGFFGFELSVRCQPACKPGFVWRAGFARVMAIPLGRPLPAASSNQPGQRSGDGSKDSSAEKPPRNALRRPYSVFLPAGLAMPLMLPCARCALTAPFHPFLAAVCFLWRFPWGCPRRKLSGTVSPWSPDFPPLRKRRPSGQLARSS